MISRAVGQSQSESEGDQFVSYPARGFYSLVSCGYLEKSTF